MATKIPWADVSWNPVTGCSPVSEACAHCYAKRMSNRLKGRYGYPKDEPFRVTFHPDKLEQPLKWRKPRRIFVCSMSDLFHKEVDWNWQYKIFERMIHAYWHNFLVLTKRPTLKTMANIWFHLKRNYDCHVIPLPNLWLGTTVELQKYDYRIDDLLQIPAAVRFLSLEPLLSDINIEKYLHCGIDWCIIGAESGPNKRFFDPDWARRIIAQCKKYNVPVFYKQDSTTKMPMIDGRKYAEFPHITNKTNGP